MQEGKKISMTMGEALWDRLSLSRCKYITLNMIAFILAGFQVQAFNPVGVAFFTAMSMKGYGSLGTVLVMILGMALSFGYVEMVKYSAVLISLFLMFQLIRYHNIRISKRTYGILCVVNVLAMELAGRYMDAPGIGNGSKTEILAWLGFPAAIAVLSGALSIVFEKGIDKLVGKQVIMNNEIMISLGMIAGCCMYGIGSRIHLPYSILEMGLYFLLLYGGYKYGAGIGALLGLLCGISVCALEGSVEMLGILCAAGTVAGVFRTLGRIPSLLAVLVTIITSGYFLVPYFMEGSTLKGVLSAGVLFLAVPKLWVEIYQQGSEYSMQEKMDNICREKLLSVAETFEKLSGSIHELSKKMPEQDTGQDTGQEIEMDGLWKRRLEENQHAMSEQLEQISQLIHEYSREIYDFVPISNEEEDFIRHKLKGKKVNMTKIVGLENRRKRREYLVTAKCLRGATVGTREVADVISAAVGKKYMPSRHTRKLLSPQYTTTSYVEETNFYVLHGAAGVAKEIGDISGDNYSFQELDNGQSVMSLSDGMGCGKTASLESGTVIELLEQLLDSGFKEEAALKIINSVMLMNSGQEHPATLDFGIIDLHSGVCDLVKIGAAATFVKRGNWIETIKSTSMPLGVFREVDCDTTRKKLYDGDMVIMVSDGVLDAMDCDDKAGKLREIIMDIKCENPEDMANQILNKALKTSGLNDKFTEGRRDDMTVLVTGIKDRKSA